MRSLILIKLIFLCIFAPNSFASSNSLSLFVDENDMGVACAVDLDGVHCFNMWNQWRNARRADGKSLFSPAATQVEVRNISILTFSPQHLAEGFFAEYDSRIFYSPYQSPQLTEVKQIAISPRELYFVSDSGVRYYTQNYCAIERSGLKCWFYDMPIKNGNVEKTILKFIPTPAFKNLKQISGDFKKDKKGNISEFCAIDDSEVKCFSEQLPNLNKNQPVLKKPSYVSFSGNTVCATDINGLHCWSNYSSEVFQPKLNRPRMVVVNNNTPYALSVCALDDAGAYCWRRDKNGYVSYEIPKLHHPRSIAASKSGACALDDSGLVCWKLGPYSNDNVARFADPSLARPWNQFDFNQLNSTFGALIKTTTATRALYFSNLASLIKTSFAGQNSNEISLSSKYMALKLVSPAVLSIDSKQGLQYTIPKFNESLQVFESDLSLKEISAIPRSDFNKRLALQSILAAINTAKEFRTGDDRVALTNLIRTLGQCIQDPTDENVNKFIGELNTYSPFFGNMKNNPKSAFLVDTIKLAKEWLGGAK